MARLSSRYSNILSTPSHPLLTTPTVTSTTPIAKTDGQSFISTITLSPLPSFLERGQLFSDRDSPYVDSIHEGESETVRHIQRLRLWRHDALVQHQYEAAAFVGDKVLSRTQDPNDAFWLAQCYYNSGHYARARNLLVKQSLLDASVACRCLAAQCLIQMEKWSEALEILGEENPFRSSNVFEVQHNVKNSDGGIKLEASMCHLRGVVFSQLSNFDRAKQCYQEALTVDSKCYDALDALLVNNLMTAEEEWSFLESLPFNGLHGEDIELVKMMYTMRLNKYRPPEVFNEAEAILCTKYGLKDNPDIMLSKGELLSAQCRFAECLKVTEGILKIDQYKFSALPLHLTCLYELGKKNDLFLLSHDMVDRHPEEPVTWLAIGIYYMSIGKIAEARRHFSKASVMNPRFGAAWIGFAHSFATEGEHDQAISAYTTAARLFQGTHLPALFLGMQHLQLNNVILADEYLNTAYNMCKTDPLLLNEIGVVCFHKQHLQHAVEWFHKALEAARATGSKESAWVSTHANLGHAYRKLKYYDRALGHFAEVRRHAPLDASSFSACGLIYMHQGKLDAAITNLHRALALAPADSLANDLLSKALMDAASVPRRIGPSDEEVDLRIDNLLLSAGSDLYDDDDVDDEGGEEGASDEEGLASGRRDVDLGGDDEAEEEEEEEEDMDYD